MLPAGRAAEIDLQADVLIATGTTLLSGTLAGLLRLPRPGVEAAVIGPTVTLRPAPFFIFRRGQ